jgi:hypothetical protein
LNATQGDTKNLVVTFAMNTKVVWTSQVTFDPNCLRKLKCLSEWIPGGL